MTMIRRALRDNGSTAVVSMTMSAVSYTLLLLGHVSSGMVSLKTKLNAVWLISGLLYPLQCILVGKRRCSRHWLVQNTAMAAYYLGTPLTFYAVNAVCSTSHFDEPLPPYILAAVGFVTINMFHSPHKAKSGFMSNMRAYSLRDGPQDPYRFVLSLVYLACAEWEWTRISSANRGPVLQIVYDIIPDVEWARNNQSLVPLLLTMTPHILFLVQFLFAASMPSESTLDYDTKAVAEYMKRESKSSSPFFEGGGDGDANSSLQLECCRYPFAQRRKDGRWISIKDLSQRADLSKEDQDIWLSYSLSRLLARRYYGFHCAEEGDVKVRRFALARLGTNDYKRAFTSVEVQLAFLHDYFFTTSLRIMESTYYKMPYRILTMAEWPPETLKIGSLMLLLALSMDYHWIKKFLRPGGGYGPDLLGAVATIVFFPYSLITQDGHFLSIYWTPIHFVFHKLDLLRNPTSSIWVKFLRHIYHSPNEVDVYRPSLTQTSTVYWSDKIGQYSVLLDYDRRCSRKKALVAWLQGLVRRQPWYKFIKHLPVEEKDIRVPDSVRKLVGDTLRAIDGPPTNGTRSLKISMDSAGYDWSWTCRQQTHTGTILIWHIATCYCDMSLHHSDRPDEDFPLLVETDTFHEVATAFVKILRLPGGIFLPEFLPEHSLITKEVLQNVIKDARHALVPTHMEEKEKCTKIRGLRLPPRRRQTTFHKGVRLGRQLEKLKWKVMAEFWAETILYVAPSDNAEAHIEHLAKGGEFVSHLWAMLSNAGILKRATGEWNPPAAAATE